RFDESLRKLREVEGDEAEHGAFREAALLRLEGNITGTTDSNRGRSLAVAGLTQEQGREILHPVPQVVFVKLDILGEHVLPKVPAELPHAPAFAHERGDDEVVST